MSVHRFVEHRGVVELELEAATEEGIFAAALEAFADLVSAGRSGAPARHEIELSDGDPVLLLVDWLNELVYLAEVDRFVPEQLTAFEHAGTRLRATVAGHRDRPRHLIKAVTLNNLALTDEGGVWRGHVVLDV